MSIIPRGIPQGDWFERGAEFIAPTLKGKTNEPLAVGDTFPNFALYDQHDKVQQIRLLASNPVFLGHLPRNSKEVTGLLQLAESLTEVTVVLLARDNIYRASFQEDYYPPENLKASRAVILHGDDDDFIRDNLRDGGEERFLPSYLISAGDQKIINIFSTVDESLVQEISRLILNR